MKTARALSRPRGHGLRSSADSIAWIFRSNLPPYRGAPLQPHQKRNFFGLGEIISVLANPGETLKSLTEARRSLEEARKEIKESRERAQLRTTHTFAPLPGFFSRPAELRAIRRILEGPPAFTVLSGASSVGKTALLREVLSDDRYHVLHFDLRIAGFADLSSLYLSLSMQMEQYFGAMSEHEGYQEFEKDSWAFKHDRLGVEHRIETSGASVVKTSDIAHLMELFQSSLLHFWEFSPQTEDDHDSSEETKVGHAEHTKERSGESERSADRSPKSKPREKKVPVIFFDEAHKLPALIRSPDAMKCLLDAMLVLTKQDRLCHVVHATSDSFYQTWLRQLNIMQHCKIISIGDCSKSEARSYFNERLLPGVPEQLRAKLEFEPLYDAFGGKLVHWADYISDFVNANGDFSVEKSSHFQQAYSLLNLHLIHATDIEASALEKEQGESSMPDHTTRGFKIYTPLSAETMVAASGSKGDSNDTSSDSQPSFTVLQLLDVMYRLTRPGVTAISYFALCRELGMRAADDMVRGRLLELRWSEPVTPEGGARFTSIATADSTDDLGPKLMPTTPIVAYAMRRVLVDYDYRPGQEDEAGEEQEEQRRSRKISSRRGRRSSGMQTDDKSDYISLSDVSEY